MNTAEPALMRESEVACLTGIPRATLCYWRINRRGPFYEAVVQVGPRSYRYRRSVVERLVFGDRAPGGDQ